MNKSGLIEELSQDEGLTKTDAAMVVDLFFEEMAMALSDGDRVEIRGLCSFSIKQYNGYVGRNPKSGSSVNVLPKKLPFFKCGKELKDRVEHSLKGEDR